MEAPEVLADAVERVRGRVRDVVSGLDRDQLAVRPGPEANPIGWLVWHLTRVQDGHVAEMLDVAQLYVQGWAERLGLDPDPGDSGYGHTSAQVARVRIDDPGVLIAYHDAVAERSLARLASLRSGELDRIVDESWDPPVTAGVRWVSIIEDSMEHIGQAAFVRGLIGR